MTWIVALALRRPYTFTVFAILILIGGVVAITRTPKDIFPSIDIPVVSVLFGYAGMSAEGMEPHMISQFERGLTTTVDNIEHIESQRSTESALSKCSCSRTPTLGKPSHKSRRSRRRQFGKCHLEPPLRSF